MRDPTAPGLPRGARWRAWLWGALAALTCPCHLPVVLLALSGTAAGALVSQHKGIAVVVLLALFALSLTRALRTFRSPR
ncbi:broad-spectrum mercury transporter MerE (plasmid) [Burkholderia gladioli]|uniref:broad-spectrum mercury transporter MerE n=1 Tax=Burkholderia gladioli TaxID=28095 RepID=UPI001936721D|nr:broad-spectrum mercury transporter MerE [Burkholderia gladioli]QPQ89172.1 broad-spectrum mercury transporter MerE [Burkholderia gladioli]